MCKGAKKADPLHTSGYVLLFSRSCSFLRSWAQAKDLREMGDCGIFLWDRYSLDLPWIRQIRRASPASRADPSSRADPASTRAAVGPAKVTTDSSEREGQRFRQRKTWQRK
ncbi:hypothetical protein Ddc_14586 [Ditylenchus destructor]|nr:hypothetical protein Ddc_14586 [Ditylenchus destructor]